MICKHCKEKIEVGEACITELSGMQDHHYFFHVGCYFTWRTNEQEKRTKQDIDLARTVK